MKKVSVLLFCFFLSLNCMAQDSKEKSDFDFNLDVIQSFEYNFLQDAKNNGFGISSYINFVIPQFNFLGGLNQCQEKTDVTAQILYVPFNFKDKHYLGFNGLYHFYNFPDEFMENDFELGGYYKVNILPYFIFSTAISYYAKISVFQTSKDMLVNHSLSADFNFEYIMTPTNRLYLSLSSNTFFDYPLLFAPTLILGTEYDVSNKIFIGTYVSSKWIDIVSAVANMTQFSVSVYGGYRL